MDENHDDSAFLDTWKSGFGRDDDTPASEPTPSPAETSSGETSGDSEDARPYYGASSGESSPYDSSTSYDPSSDTSYYDSGGSDGGDTSSTSDGWMSSARYTSDDSGPNPNERLRETLNTYWDHVQEDGMDPGIAIGYTVLDDQLNTHVKPRLEEGADAALDYLHGSGGSDSSSTGGDSAAEDGAYSS